MVIGQVSCGLEPGGTVIGETTQVATDMVDIIFKL